MIRYVHVAHTSSRGSDQYGAHDGGYKNTMCNTPNKHVRCRRSPELGRYDMYDPSTSCSQSLTAASANEPVKAQYDMYMLNSCQVSSQATARM